MVAHLLLHTYEATRKQQKEEKNKFTIETSLPNSVNGKRDVWCSTQNQAQLIFKSWLDFQLAVPL